MRRTEEFKIILMLRQLEDLNQSSFLIMRTTRSTYKLQDKSPAKKKAFNEEEKRRKRKAGKKLLNASCAIMRFTNTEGPSSIKRENQGALLASINSVACASKLL